MARSSNSRSGGRRPLRPRAASALVVLALVVTGCARPEPAGGNEELLTLESRMQEQPDGWQTGPVEGGARLDFVPTGYRMTATGWPLVAPNLDPRATGLDPVDVRAELNPVSGQGLYGVACAVTGERAYVFVVGRREQGEPYYGIAALSDGVAESLQDSTAAGMVPAGQVIGDDDGPVAVTAVCRSAGGGADLVMSVDDATVASVHVPDAVPRGQVGLVAVSRSAAELVVDVGTVVVRAVR